MKSMRIKLISFLLVIVLAAFMLTGCSSLDLIIDYLFSTPSQTPEEPEADEFSIEDAINEITTSKMCATTPLFSRSISATEPIWFLGITRMWVGAWGAMSRNARMVSSS